MKIVSECTDVAKRKQKIKLLQRICMSFFPFTVAVKLLFSLFLFVQRILETNMLDVLGGKRTLFV